MTKQTNGIETLTGEQRAFARSMLHDPGATALKFAMLPNGEYLHQLPLVTHGEFVGLLEDFKEDPERSIVAASDMLFSIGGDPRLTLRERQRKVGEYLNEYENLIVRLDRAAFPPDPTNVHHYVPEYIPDGLTDMGAVPSIDPRFRHREQTVVDKKSILKNSEPFLTAILTADYKGKGRDAIDAFIVKQAAAYVFAAYPYHHPAMQNNGDIGEGGDLMLLSGNKKSVCRHQALLYQVIVQSLGVTSRLKKCFLNDEPHVINAVRVGGEWSLVDVTNPDSVLRPDGQREWAFSRFAVPENPTPDMKTTYRLPNPKSRVAYDYRFRDDMYWRVVDPAVCYQR